LEKFEYGLVFKALYGLNEAKKNRGAFLFFSFFVFFFSFSFFLYSSFLGSFELLSNIVSHQDLPHNSNSSLKVFNFSHAYFFASIGGFL
jgi:hypothetical protein